MKFNLLNKLLKICILVTGTTILLSGCGRNATDVRDERTAGDVGIETGLSDSQVTATNAAATFAAIDSTKAASSDNSNASSESTDDTQASTLTAQDIIDEETENFEAATPYKPSQTVSSFSVEYKEAIENMKTQGIMPDGTKMAVAIDDMNDSEYVICDIDEDGRDELVIRYNDGGESGSIEGVYEYDSDNLTCRCELSCYPGVEYYKDGMILAPWSPINQGLDPDFQPFNIYVYNPETDVYDYKGYIDRWDHHVNETDYEGNKFPEKHDENENGVLYSIQYADQYGHGYIHDDPEYKELYSRLYVGDKIRIDWLGL